MNSVIVLYVPKLGQVDNRANYLSTIIIKSLSEGVLLQVARAFKRLIMVL